MAVKSEQVRRTLMDKRFVRYKEGAEMYSIGLIAFEEFLESFRE